MNDAHKFGKKLNRFKRLVKKLADAPLDSYKSQRKQELERELKAVKLIK